MSARRNPAPSKADTLGVRPSPAAAVLARPAACSSPPGPPPSLAAPNRGFSLIELLTVIAIIAILATLLMTALGSSKERARQIVCTSNLRQISLAMNMYLDDLEKRPQNLDSLMHAKYVANQDVFLCPDDRTKNWGGLVNQFPTLNGSSYSVNLGDSSAQPETPAPSSIRYSYLHPLHWNKEAWDRLMQAGPGAGFATCELHGLGKQDTDSPSIYNFQGLILRAQRDGAVVRRQNFWGKAGESLRAGDSPATAPTTAAGFYNGLPLEYPWTLFTDAVPATE